MKSILIICDELRKNVIQWSLYKVFSIVVSWYTSFSLQITMAFSLFCLAQTNIKIVLCALSTHLFFVYLQCLSLSWVHPGKERGWASPMITSVTHFFLGHSDLFFQGNPFCIHHLTRCFSPFGHWKIPQLPLNTKRIMQINCNVTAKIST